MMATIDEPYLAYGHRTAGARIYEIKIESFHLM
jgi:hypothetical protein